MSEVIWHPIKRIEGNLYWPFPDWDDTNDDDCVLVTLADGRVRSVLLCEPVEGEGYCFDGYDVEEIKAWADSQNPTKATKRTRMIPNENQENQTLPSH